MTDPIPPGAMRVPDIAGLLTRTPPHPMRDEAGDVAGLRSGDGGRTEIGVGDPEVHPPADVPAASPTPSVRQSTGPNRRSAPRRHRPDSGSGQQVGGLTLIPIPEPSEVNHSREYLRMITVHVPRSVHEALARQALIRETTRTALILEAVDATYLQIGEALAQQQNITVGNLFNIPQRAAGKDPLVEVKLRVTDRQLNAIQTLVQQNATSRSKLVSAALRLHLVI